MSVVPAIAALEMYYRDYLFACKKLQFDPVKIYDQSFVDQKVDDALSSKELDKKEQKTLEWFKKYYGKMEGGFFGNKLVSRAKKEIRKGKLILDYEIIE